MSIWEQNSLPVLKAASALQRNSLERKSFRRKKVSLPQCKTSSQSSVDAIATQYNGSRTGLQDCQNCYEFKLRLLGLT
jgi:hypothetical protein